MGVDAEGSGRDPTGWSKLSAQNYGQKFASLVAGAVQRRRVEMGVHRSVPEARWELRGTGLGVRRLGRRQMARPGRGSLGALGFVGSVAEVTVYTFCQTHRRRFWPHGAGRQLVGSALAGHPEGKEAVAVYRLVPSVVCLPRLYDRVMWTAVHRAIDPIIDQQFGFVPGAQSRDKTELFRGRLPKARVGGPSLRRFLGWSTRCCVRSAGARRARLGHCRRPSLARRAARVAEGCRRERG